MKILSVVGARPNFVKMAPLAQQFEKRGATHVLVHTGQHYDYNMSSVFFKDLALPSPDKHLGVGSGTHGVQTGRMMAELEKELLEESPDLTLVVGDVNSTLAAAIASVKLGIPVAHVEAGYRSFDMHMPEEINRVLVDRISQLLFAPTENAVLNLMNEGMRRESIHFVGNIMIEALLGNIEQAKDSQVMGNLGLKKREYFVATIHRPHNVERENLKLILEMLSEAPLPVVFPAHPRTREAITSCGLEDVIAEHVVMIKALGYLDFIGLLSSAAGVLTDSGGVQEEALVLKVPCLTLRETTERIETVRAGANRLCGLNREKVRNGLRDAVENQWRFEIPLFWDNHVSERIADIIEQEDFSIPAHSML
ncbi:MAG: UDP-N-acetylglucosamine 2-epimerase (non-hydrolyzing) [Theionarchaea archaeon]|nr:UDP-N-acetylglucosamine 2-epimerase (non-hydrolyzing) [Theionarchaea archaeon]MBU7039030.1 UDP-N-acetylglucosamine 2-epimerase (non-hydrolyzing) [Theionarchaea archaeon]